MRSSSKEIGPRRVRGGRAWAFLLGSLVLAAGSLWGLRGSSGEPPPFVAANPWSLARTSYADRDLRLAEATLREILRAQPDRRDARLLLGRVLCERGRTVEARELFSSLSNANTDPDALRGLGAVSENERQFDLAASFYRRAVELRKDDPALWRDLARTQAARADGIGALASIQESLRLDPGQTDLLVFQSELAATVQAPQSKPPGWPRMADTPGKPVEVAVPSGPRIPDPSRAFPKPDGRIR